MASHPADINGFVLGFDDRFYERSVMGEPGRLSFTSV
jgi:hypothetical protein